MINPQKFLEDAYFQADRFVIGAPQTAVVYAVFGVAAGLFAIAAAIIRLAETLAKKK